MHLVVNKRGLNMKPILLEVEGIKEKMDICNVRLHNGK